MKTYIVHFSGCTPGAAGVRQAIPKVIAEDLELGLRSIKSGKAKDSKDSRTEMLQVEGIMLRAILLQLMSVYLEAGAPTAAEWRESVLKVLFKGGDATQAKNY